MRLLFVMLLLVFMSGCAVKPEYTIQSATGVEVGLSKSTNKTFLLVDENGNVVAKANPGKNKLKFNISKYTSPSSCYTIIDDEGKRLYDKDNGFRITSVNNFIKSQEKLLHAKRKRQKCIENEGKYHKNLRASKTDLSNNSLFNGKTCELPAQRNIPPFPKAICGSYSQCKKLANDSCIKNLIDAESCSAALAKTKVHGSINSVSCGAILASLNGSQYGIGAGVQDAITGYLDEHTKNMINTGEYGKAIATGIVRIAFTYYRTESCKDDFFEAAYAPVERWINEKNYIEKEPYLRQSGCNKLIREHNSHYDRLSKSRACVKDLDKTVALLSGEVQKKKSFTSVPEECSFK